MTKKFGVLVLAVMLLLSFGASTSWAALGLLPLDAILESLNKTVDQVTIDVLEDESTSGSVESSGTAGGAEYDLSIDYDVALGLEDALERVKSDSSDVAQSVLQRLVDAEGDAQSVARALRDTAREELAEVNSETREQLKAAAREAREKATEAKGLAREKRKEILADVARFYENAGSVVEAIDHLKDAIRQDPRDLDIYKRIGELYKKQGEAELRVYVEGETPSFDILPIIKKGRTLVPFRTLAESLGALVDWDEINQKVTITRGEDKVELQIGKATAFINGEEYSLDVPAYIQRGRTMVPLRFISEALKTNVEYVADANIVVVYK